MRQTWTEDRGEDLVTLRDALECSLAEIVESGKFWERRVCVADGMPVPHTSAYRPTLGTPYELQGDRVADVH